MRLDNLDMSQLDELFKMKSRSPHDTGGRGGSYGALMAMIAEEEDAGMTQQQFRNYESLLLDKLQHMVPIMPRDRQLSKLEIINYVIDYIKQLRELVVGEQTLQESLEAEIH